ncbi:MAG: cytochrome C [Acidobacteriota bacterium]
MMHSSRTAVVVCSVGVVLGTSLLIAASVRGDVDRDEKENRVHIGLAASPIPPDLTGRDRNLVGLGSYLVNVSGDCNGCHTSVENSPYLPGGNPFMGQPETIDPSRYLVGGRVFIPAHGPFPAIVSRNLRPEANGMPAGHTYAEFLTIFRTGIDMDHAHPQYGPLLQVMPWPNFSKITDHEIRAIYEYLSALPPNPAPQP